MYRPRHATSSRLPGVPLAGSLLLVWALVAPGASRPAQAHLTGNALTPPVRVFDATPVVVGLPEVVRRAPYPLPTRATLLLPATELPGATFRPVRGRVPAGALRAYRAASAAVRQDGCTLPWQLLAAVGGVVSDHGRAVPQVLLDGRHGYLMTDSDHGRYDGNADVDGPVGPFGLLPETFVRTRVGATADPRHLKDAAVAAARYLCTSSTDLSKTTTQRAAVTAYDPQPGFAEAVLLSERRLTTR